MKSIQKTGWFWFATACGLAAAAIFIAWPMRSVQQWLPNRVGSYDLVLIIGLLAVGLGTLLLRRIEEASPPRGETRSHFWNTSKTWAILLGAAFLAQALFHINSPLGIDENVHGLQMARGDLWNEITPFIYDESYSTQNHVLSHIASYLSLQLFGVNKISLRLPAIIFSLLLVWILYSRRASLSPIVFTFIFGHLLVNQLIVWYSHSMRGYILMIAASSFLFLEAFRFARGERIPLRPIAVVYLLTPFTHIFGGVFAILLWMTLVVWIVVNHSNLSKKQWEDGRKIVRWGLLLMPLILLMFGFEAIRLMRLGDLQSAETPGVLSWVIPLFGFSYSWQAKIFLLMVIGFTIHAVLQKRWTLPLIFILTTACFVLFLLFALKVRILLPRYMLGFVLPVALFLVVETEALTDWKRHAGRALLALCLIAFPVMSGPAVQKLKQQDFLPYDNFLKRADVATRKFPDRCFKYSGKADLISWAKEFYLRKVPVPGPNCKHRFLLHMGDSPSQTTHRKLLDEGPNLALYQLF